jgi:hypothetical protein
MGRTDQQVGCINWPDFATHRDTGEGGLFVYLVVPTQEGEAPRDYSDPMEKCCIGTWPTLNMPDVVLSKGADKYWHRDRYWQTWNKIDGDMVPRQAVYEYADSMQSVHFLAVVLLGSTGMSWVNDNTEEYFIAQYDNLTDEGKALYKSLASLYSRSPIILTFLDT